MKKTNVSSQNLRPSLSPTKSPSKPAYGLSPSIPVEAGQNINYNDMLREPLQLPQSKVRAPHLLVKKFLTISIQLQNDYLREYVDKRKFYLARILASEAPPIERLCSGCGTSGDWRCLDCLGRPLFCKDCCRNAHWNNPFHKIQQWDEEYFKDSSLLQVGLTLYFGHGGRPCPSMVNPSHDFHPDEGEDEPMFGLPDLPQELSDNDDDDLEFGSVPFSQMESDDDGSLLERDVREKTTHPKNVLVIVHSNGVHHLPVQWCTCPGHIPDDIQALDLQFFPASFKQVKSLFTFEGLDSFLAENQECKASAWHYYKKLRRFTSTCYPETVPVRTHPTYSNTINPNY